MQSPREDLVERRTGHDIQLAQRLVDGPRVSPYRLKVALGIVPFLYVVPVPLAVAHQGSALALFGLAVCSSRRR